MEADRLTAALADMEPGARAEVVVDALAEGADTIDQLVAALDALGPAESTLAICDAVGEARKRADPEAAGSVFELAARLRSPG